MVVKKTITDPVHGSISLTALEADIVQTKAFQRLHNVRQLGLAYYVFPAANYSRFSHSLGACHNASRILDAIVKNSRDRAIELLPKYQESLRLGALLHDLGHYPFSHATEHVVGNYYKSSMMQSEHGASTGPSEEKSGIISNYKSLNHEKLGEFILENDPELQAVFSRHDKDLKDVIKIFGKSDPENTLVEIISSDLDCDRLDYLCRTSHHTGLPYGSVDTNFLVSQAALDSQYRFGYLRKAARAADHLLISRYYDYLQVPYHKTVAALEWSLVSCIEELLSRGKIKCHTEEMKRRISDGTWGGFDDNYFFEEFRKLLRDDGIDDILKDHLRSILERRPAKVLFEKQELIPVNKESEIVQEISDVERVVSDIADENGIDRSRLKVWPICVDFAKYRKQQVEDDDATGAVRIIDGSGDNSSLLGGLKETIFCQLLGMFHRGYRVFYLAEPGKSEEEVANLRKLTAEKMQNSGW